MCCTGPVQLFCKFASTLLLNMYRYVRGTSKLLRIFCVYCIYSNIFLFAKVWRSERIGEKDACSSSGPRRILVRKKIDPVCVWGGMKRGLGVDPSSFFAASMSCSSFLFSSTTRRGGSDSSPFGQIGDHDGVKVALITGRAIGRVEKWSTTWLKYVIQYYKTLTVEDAKERKPSLLFQPLPPFPTHPHSP